MPGDEARDGQDVLAAHFAAGSGSPAYVIVPEGDVATALEVLGDSDGVDSVAAASQDSPSGQVQVELSGGDVVYTTAGPPAAAGAMIVRFERRSVPEVREVIEP